MRIPTQMAIPVVCPEDFVWVQDSPARSVAGCRTSELTVASCMGAREVGPVIGSRSRPRRRPETLHKGMHFSGKPTTCTTWAHLRARTTNYALVLGEVDTSHLDPTSLPWAFSTQTCASAYSTGYKYERKLNTCLVREFPSEWVSEMFRKGGAWSR